jgi:hypothetical protein
LASKPIALVDATDLLPQDQRDFLVQAALDGLFRMVWSETILQEAVVGGADTVVTSDGRFDASLCQKMFDLRVVDVDDFLVDIFTQADDQHLQVPLDALASRWKRPARFSRAQVIGRLTTPLPKAMGYLIEARGFSRDDPPDA